MDTFAPDKPNSDKKAASDTQARPGNKTADRKGAIKMPSINMPKGGGAIKGIGDTFAPDAFTGTASYSIAVPVTAARGLEPHLTVEYNSSNGNSPFGMGFSLDLPRISLRTSKGIPRYDDHDIFMWNGSELVLNKQVAAKTAGNWNVYEYLPRVEGDFSRIQQFIKTDASESYWIITDADNTVSRFGISPASRIFNPNNPAQIFEWLIDDATDAEGNRIVYTYKAENADNVPDVSWEKNRSYNNKYIEQIQYGNYTGKQGQEQFAYAVIFDYGEYVLPTPDNNDPFKPLIIDPFKPVHAWNYRPDAFSSYLSGFEIRTCRLCSNILLFHRFEDELGDPCLIQTLHFDYQNANAYNDANHPGLSILSKATLTGYRRTGKNALDAYNMQSLPPLAFTFSGFNPPQQPAFKQLTICQASIPGYLGNAGFEPVDLHGEGLPGLLYHAGASIFYCAPEGHGHYDAPSAPLLFPADRDFATENISLTDLNGDGTRDLVVRNATRNGFYRNNSANGWEPFTPFPAYATNLDDPHIEMAGLSNNGKTDAILVDTDQLTVYPSHGTKGYAAPIAAKKQAGFPSVKAGYVREFVGFADMLGDGLSHRVKISNGSVECWPDMGYGVFGKNFSLGNAPVFGNDFDISRLFMADIDGSGATDLVYVHRNKIDVYINQSGNYFSDPITVYLPEDWSSSDQIQFADIKGNGTQCLIFTKAGTTMRHYYYDFTGDTIFDGQPHPAIKPYLLIEADNNLGAVSRVHYCSSTKFYLEDKKAGTPWVTRLPFPVQVIEKIQVIDRINNASYATRYKFHDGHYDPVERTFIGFGFVETWDTETYETVASQSQYTMVKKDYYVPPVHTKTWYHTGAAFHNPAVMAHYKAQFFQGDTKAYDFPDVVFDADIYTQDADTLRQAYLALQGEEIRSEIYADDQADNPDLYLNPYTVEQSNARVKLFQPKGDQPYAVFQVAPRESISYHYERNPADPRITQEFTLLTDSFGNPVISCAVNLARRANNAPDFVKYPEQFTVKGTLSYTNYVNPVDGYLFHDIASEEQAFELAGIEPDSDGYFTFDGIKTQIDTIGLPDRSKIVEYGQPFTTGVQARQMTWDRHYFWNWANPEEEPVLGAVYSPALIHHSESAVFPKSFTIDTYDGRLIDEAGYENDGYLSNVICTHGGYFFEPDTNYWWNKGLVQYYLQPPTVPGEPQTFYLPSKTENSYAAKPLARTNGSISQRTQDPSLIACSIVEYDKYYLFVTQLTEIIDANTSNTVHASIDYVTSQPYQFIDVNGNTTQVLFDPLQQVIVSSIFGLENGDPAGGMTLYAQGNKPPEYQDAGLASFADVLANPQKYLQGAGTYYYYNVNAWTESQQPHCAISLVRNHYWHSPDRDSSPYCQVLIQYVDGLGRDIEKKIRYGVENVPNATIPGERWQVSGRTVYNNKDVPCEQYLPYFSPTAAYEEQKDIPGPPPTVMHFDPLLRLIRVDTPKGFFSKVEFTPWQVAHYDEDDTVLDSWYYQNEYPGNLTPNEIDAIKKAVIFYNTPATTIYDNTGVAFLEIQNNLGNVTSDAFLSLQTPVISAEAIWKNLLNNGYIAPYPEHKEMNLHFVSSKFQPYTPGFQLHLDPQYKDILQAITDILKENCLTSYYETDISGRLIQSVDPRIYYNNIIHNTSNCNFRYRYAMEVDHPVLTDSMDAGTQNPQLQSSAEKQLSNIFGSTYWIWTARRYCQFSLFDRMQRPLALNVKQITEPGPVTNYDDFARVQIYTYGESLAGPLGYNLRNQVYEVKDLSGISITDSYTMTGQPLQVQRQLLQDYKANVDWSGLQPLLEDKIYPTRYTYNAMQQMLTQTTPDGSVTTNTYDESAHLQTVSVQYGGTSTVQDIVTDIRYNAKGQRLLVKYGNGVTTKYTYEETTLRLTAINSTRPANGSAETVVQDMQYFYDPAGNITRTLDNTSEIIFNKNQRIDPLSDYTYNAIYKLIRATGRQHTGITANTYQNNDSCSFKQCYFGPPPFASDSDKLENYIETYTYDDSGNLIFIKHSASSTTSWSRNLPVDDYSNRLKNATYDAAGNPLQLDISNNVPLTWNCFNQLSRAGIIQRQNQPDDCDYYQYDATGGRTRRASEKLAQGGAVTMVEDKVYIRNFEVKRTYNVSAGGNKTITAEQQSLRVMDDVTCVAVIHFTTIDRAHSQEAGKAQCRFQLDNQIGSVCLELDAAAQLITYEEYFPYGGTAIITGIDEAEVKAKEYRYSGKERDDTTGLYYYGARYYAPWQARWLNPDPAGTVDGMNLFAFVQGNPVTNKDENGNIHTRSGLSTGVGPPKKKVTPKAKKAQALKAQPLAMKTTKKKKGGKKKKGKGNGHGNLLLSRVRASTLGVPTVGYTPADKSFKTTIRIHWKGYRDANGLTTGINPNKTTRDKTKWDSEHDRATHDLSQMLIGDAKFTPLNNGSSSWGAENSHLIAGSLWGPNDALSAPPASVHQNTEWLSIEEGIKELMSKSNLDIRLKATGYINDSTGNQRGFLASARYKIYINGVKVFDHVSKGDRMNIDKDEATNLKDRVKNLSTASPPITFLGKATKGISPMSEPTVQAMRQGRVQSPKSPMFTDLNVSGTKHTGQTALNWMNNLYKNRK